MILLVTFVAYENFIFLLFGANYGVRMCAFFWCFSGVGKHQRCVLRIQSVLWVSRISGRLRIVAKRVALRIVTAVKRRSSELLIFAIVWWWKLVEMLANQG